MPNFRAAASSTRTPSGMTSFPMPSPAIAAILWLFVIEYPVLTRLAPGDILLRPLPDPQCRHGIWLPPVLPAHVLMLLVVRVHRRTSAGQIAVSPDVIDTSHRDPVFRVARGHVRESSLFACVRVRPFHLQQCRRRMGC